MKPDSGRRAWLRQGVLAGLAFGGVGTFFTLVSILVPIERWIWLRLFDLNGIVMFSLCATASFRVRRATGRVSSGILASLVAGMVGGVIYTAAQLLAPYAFFDQLVHYPFLHEDYTHTGMASIHDYLASDKGYWGVVGTTVGMLQYILPVTGVLAAVFGAVGAAVGGWGLWNRHPESGSGQSA
jgi:hypothetical protein